MSLCFVVNQTPECLCQQPIGFSLYLLLVRLSSVSSLCNLPSPTHRRVSTTYPIHTLKQDSQQYSRLRNNSHLPKLLAWLTNANTAGRAVPYSSTQNRYTSLVSTLQNCVAKQITMIFSNDTRMTGKYLRRLLCILCTMCMK
jgi:hypothetical protein